MKRWATMSIQPRKALTIAIVATSAQNQGQLSTPIRIAIVAGLVRIATTVAARDRRFHSPASASRVLAFAGTVVVPVLPSDSIGAEGSAATREVQPPDGPGALACVATHGA